MLQRNISLSDQLVEELISRISEGDLVAESGRLPSEAELSERYAISRATVREALTKMENSGIVIRRHGVGTFVNQTLRKRPALIRGWLNEAPAFVDLIAGSGHRPDCKLLEVAFKAAGNTATHLGIDAEAVVVSVEKLFLADNDPVIYSVTALPGGLVEPDTQGVLSQARYRQPVYQLLEEQSQHKVHHQQSEIKAVPAGRGLAELLACQPGDPLIQVEEIGYALDQTALFYALHHFRGDRVSFRQIRVPSFTITPQ